MTERPLALSGGLPNDRRLEALNHLEGHFPFTPPESLDQWQHRAQQVRRRLLVSLGLWPLPSKTPLNAVIHGRVERADYLVEKVYFESMPGFFVTGNLYRPQENLGNHPGVLCPHGHWPDGRFHEKTEVEIRKEFEQGAEQFFEGGRSPLQARCVQLARMGCVVFHYDMIGYADSVQLSLDLAHLFAKQLSEMNTLENWGLYSAQAESHAQSVMGLQTYNCIRALDFISELPDVDPDRLAMTGASGGGTQTLITGALDPRLAVCFPAVMPSTGMQGGCTCENACGLRIGTGNIEITALFAPKPLLLSSADDWTIDMSEQGFPELRQHYEMMGAPDNVDLVDRTEFKHNYNSVSRHAMYRWFNRHLKIGLTEPIEERDYQRLTRTEMSVWDDQHPQPAAGAEAERNVLQWWHEDSKKQLDGLAPHDSSSLVRYREVVGEAWNVLLGRGLPEASDLETQVTDQQQCDGHRMESGVLRNRPHGEELPFTYLSPANWNGQTIVWLDAQGKAGLWGCGGKFRPAIQQLLDAGTVVLGVDLFCQGEFLLEQKPFEQTRQVEFKLEIKNPRQLEILREAAAYTFGYNHPVFAQRVHDVLTALAMIRSRQEMPQRTALLGLRGAGHWAAAACALAGNSIDAAAIDTQGFRFGQLLDLRDPDFLPGAAKYGDLPTTLALAAPLPVWLAGEGDSLPASVAAAYQAAGALEQVELWSGDVAERDHSAVEWVLQH